MKFKINELYISNRWTERIIMKYLELKEQQLYLKLKQLIDLRHWYKYNKKYHPDKNKDPHAKEIFQQITEAYGLLSNEEKRDHYDQFGSVKDMDGVDDDMDLADILSMNILDILQMLEHPFKPKRKKSDESLDTEEEMDL